MTAPHGDPSDVAPSTPDDARPDDARPVVLIVDDEPLNARLIVIALQDQYTLLTATNGLDALRLMKEHRPDLVLLDVMRPDIDGLEVVRRARAYATLTEIPIVFVTAVADSKGQAAALQLSATDYLVKPINLTHLRLRVRNLLELKRQRDELRAVNGALASRNAELEVALHRVRELEQQMAAIISIAEATRSE